MRWILVTDVDGTLTNGNYFYNSEGVVMKEFSTYNSFAIKVFKNLGWHVILLSSASDSTPSASINRKFAEDLSVDYVCAPLGRKVDSLMEHLLQTNFSMDYLFDRMVYLGDNYDDLSILRRARQGVWVGDKRPKELEDIGNLLIFPSSNKVLYNLMNIYFCRDTIKEAITRA